ncbi:MAG: hypothetical protein K9N49_10035, partial [Candidatus Marinimicrobia bacterium]|nr:hypothetical protein [Candidatus Neomarinimicrobiota bacterium]
MGRRRQRANRAVGRRQAGWRSAGLALLLTVVAWCGLAWPLPLDLTRGIPASARHAGPQTRRYLVPGDHLQLLYHFQLVAGFMRGDPPLFYNLYEFNTGDDEARYLPGKYYAPFSVVFGALAPLAGAALAWNLLGLLALWLTLWFTWLLVRRLAPEPWIAWPAALVALLLPYRWITLAGGSPTGLAMLYPPLVLLGVDVMVADRKPWGGVLAGLAIYFAGWTDDHTFFFCALAS